MKIKAYWKNLKKGVRVTIIVLLAVLAIDLAARFAMGRQKIHVDETQWVRIPRGTTYEGLLDTLNAHGCLKNRAAFVRIARLRGLHKHVREGSYRIEDGTSIVSVVQKIYSGRQDPVRLTIGKHRTLESLCLYMDKKLELSGDSLLALMQDTTVASRYDHTPQTIIGLFIPNTYEVYWTLSPTALLDRMAKESDRFWNSVRRGQCKNIGLTPDQAIILASIVEEETNQNDEKPLIASVYLNRLRKGMELQADPTVRFANGDFSVKRIGGPMLLHPSPYNTYLHPGLPPGPICIPSIASIDAVLSGISSPYLYFCAKEDFSGMHNFAATLAEHQVNANKFHRALDLRRIGQGK
ncbi:MAG: endolytic transglycosylase MltG [Bacteroidales bacterium]|nr:endolytic transglycosylase MltG [Bacteroidales bacterium]